MPRHFPLWRRQPPLVAADTGQVPVNADDPATATDAVLDVILLIDDPATAAEAVVLSPNIDDSAAASDAVADVIVLSGDTATLAEAQLVGVLAGDAGTVSESAAIGMSAADSAIGADAVQVVSPQVNDTPVGSDQVAAVAPVVADAAAASETPLVGVNPGDTATVSELGTPGPLASETATASDAGAIVSPQAAESASSSDAVLDIVVLIDDSATVTDSGSGGPIPTVVSSSDAGTGSDAAGIGVPVDDPSLASEGALVGVNPADTASGVDQPLLGPLVSDLTTASDAAAITYLMAVGDTAGAADVTAGLNAFVVVDEPTTATDVGTSPDAPVTPPSGGGGGGLPISNFPPRQHRGVQHKVIPQRRGVPKKIRLRVREGVQVDERRLAVMLTLYEMGDLSLDEALALGTAR